MQNENRSVLDTDKIGRLLVTLSLPVFLGMFVQTLYNVVNTIFMGHFVGPLAIAGLSIVFPLQMMCWGISMMVGFGASSLMSRYLGSGEPKRAEHVLGNAVVINIVFSLALTAVILYNLEFWLRLIGASDEVLPFARDYAVIVIGGTVFNVFGNTLLNLIRAEGNARVGMTGMIIGAVLNIILDSIFIVWLGWGARGAAMGTVIAQIVAMIYLLSYYFTGSSYLKIRAAYLKLDFGILKQMLTIGIASFIQSVATSLSALFVIRLVVIYGGDVALSAFGIIQRVMMFALMPAIVLGQGMQPILGFNFGARRLHLAIRSLTMAHIAATSLSFVAFFVLFFLPRPIISIFTTDASVVESATYAARHIFVALPIIGMAMVGSSSFQSLGKATQAFITALARPVGFLIPAALLLPRFLQLDGVWYAFPVADSLTFLLTVILTIPVIREFRRAAATGKTPTEKQLAGARL
jgi:putative MATE family efflux protein